MNDLLVSAFQEILQLPYMHGSVNFDAALLKVFTHSGKLERRDTPTGTLVSRMVLFNQWNKDKRWIVIPQPFGKQRYPDFILILGGDGIIYIEAKSSIYGIATWNSGYPKHGYDRVYILNGQKGHMGSHTTFILGKDLITLENEEMLKTLRPRLTKFNKELDLEYAGQDFHPAHLNPKNIQRRETRKWLNLPIRKQREVAVIEYLSHLTGE